MGKNADKKTAAGDFEDPVVEKDSRKPVGLLATLAILTIVGIAIWFLMSQDEAS